MKIIVPIRPKNFEEFCLLEKKINKRADLIEIWLDAITDLALFFAKLEKHEKSLPLLGVCKTEAEKGSFKGTEDERLEILLQFLQSGGAFVDLDVVRNNPDIIQQLPQEKLLLSFHDFEGTPEALDIIFENMQVLKPQVYKFAVTPQSEADLARFLAFAQNVRLPSIFTTMGNFGTQGREKLKNQTWGGFFALDEKSKTASGQQTISNE